MYESDYCPIVYRKELGKILRLSPKQITYLIDTGIIETKFLGKSEIVNRKSLQKFQKNFNRDNYITKSQCIDLIRSKGYYSDYDPLSKLYTNCLMRFPHTISHFAKRGYLITYKIGSTIFVTKKSVDKLILGLDELHKELYGNGDFEKIYNSKKNSKFKKIKPFDIIGSKK
jgi:hypothetical protein